MNETEYKHILAKVRAARDHGYNVLSTEERLAAALMREPRRLAESDGLHDG